MKNRIKLTKLPTSITEHFLKEHPESSSLEYQRKGYVVEELTLNPDAEHSSLGYISTPVVDRDGDVVDPLGVELKYYQDNPIVLWGHDTSEMPIGTCREISKSYKGLQALTEFILENPKGKVAWAVAKASALKATSIGFVVEEALMRGQRGWNECINKMCKQCGVTSEYFKEANRIITKSTLLEYSFVNIPACQEAIQTAISTKQLDIEDEEIKIWIEKHSPTIKTVTPVIKVDTPVLKQPTVTVTAIPEIKVYIPKISLNKSYHKISDTELEAEVIARLQGRI